MRAGFPPSYKSRRVPTDDFFISCPLPAHITLSPSSFAPPHIQDPKKEISARDAHKSEATVKKYFTLDAKFSHPLCKANSQNKILGLGSLVRRRTSGFECEYSSCES
ncbi:hypothetical protein OG21DRAFT_440360 [Imleria badia]|nr:hypothetical protein OG21DRAFT_440360 [Imleria badia]